jgi:glycosyltransferase involved in cell wall biosynthesis
MKILMVPPVPPDRGAPGAIPPLLHAALTGLAARNEVTLALAAGPDPAEWAAVERLQRDGWDVLAVRRHMDPRRWRRRARMSTTWLRGREPWRTTWFTEPTLQVGLHRLLAQRSFDVVAVEDNSMAMYQLRTDAATILTEYEVRRPRPIDWRPGTPRQWPGWAFREMDWRRWPRYQRTAWRRFDALQVFTDRDAQSVVELAPELAARVHIAPFGIELPPIAQNVTAEPNTIAFLGNYTHPPNVDAARWLASDVLPRVRHSVPDAELRLAGIHAPSTVRSLEAPGVTVVGVVDDADAFLRRHAVVVAPIRTGGGMRMKVLHAMALGAAVVTTPRGAEGLRLDDPAPLAIAENADDIAEAVVRLLRDGDERQRLGERARSFVEEHHSPDAVARRLEAVYTSAIEMRRSVPPR